MCSVWADREDYGAGGGGEDADGFDYSCGGESGARVLG